MVKNPIPELVTRLFRPEDTKEIIELFRNTVRRINVKDYSPDQTRAWAPDKMDHERWCKRLLGSFSYVAESESNIVGFANLEPSGHVDFFYVHASHQGQGIGKALMSCLETQARSLMLEKLFAEVGITARPFFQRLGFTIVAEQSVTFNSAQFINYQMSKPLTSKTVLAESITASIEYLQSDAAIQSIEADPYWPKWDSPWWHMTLLNEMGLAKKIPERAICKMTDQLKTHYLKIFPVHPGELPEGTDAYRETSCHCALGNIYQTLCAWGVDVELELPWIRQWFLRYQLPDGGLNCDNEAYLKSPPPSSIVGTISPLEAVLNFTARDFTPEEIKFLDLGARCLMDRKLIHATANPHNPEEKEDEEDWLKLCFPRFYLYDILRGLTFILRWADKRNKSLSRDVIAPTVEHLEKHFPDGRLRMGRHSFDGKTTLILSSSDEWLKRQPATHFPLLDQVSKIGEISPHLNNQWNEAKILVESLSERGLLKTKSG